jgi:restriction endonuclease Mrr
MPIPDFQTIMLPLLKFAADKKEHSLSEGIEHIGRLYKIICGRKIRAPSQRIAGL